MFSLYSSMPNKANFDFKDIKVFPQHRILHVNDLMTSKYFQSVKVIELEESAYIDANVFGKIRFVEVNRKKRDLLDE